MELIFLLLIMGVVIFLTIVLAIGAAILSVVSYVVRGIWEFFYYR